MAEIQVKVLYDFDAQPGSAEINIQADEIIVVTRQDVGEGWWEGKKINGEVGLFPQAYVEVVQESGPPEMPPPPLPSTFTDGRQPDYNTPDSYQLSVEKPAAKVMTDDWDETRDDEDTPSSKLNAISQDSKQPGGNFGLHTANREHGHSGEAKFGTVKKSFNRFSTFVKSGGEAYLLGTIKTVVSDADRIAIVESDDGPVWAVQEHPYTCSVTSPKKDSKFRGMKSFIAYQVTPSFNMVPVTRRYKHFDWLHGRLEDKFCVTPVSPLPDKQVTGRYEDDFIEKRMAGLQLWVSRICRHPVIANSEVWNHFLTCADEKRWKQGKRKAEKDEFVAGSFFLIINTPENPLSVKDVEEKVDSFNKFVKHMDDSVRDGIQTMLESCKKHRGPYKREYQKMGDVLIDLGNSFSLDTRPLAQGLTEAIRHTGKTYNEIAQDFADQPRYDLEPLIEEIHEYKGILSNFPEIIELHKGALKRVKDCQKLEGEGKLNEADASAIARRGDVLSYALLAEITHFHSERILDYKTYMQNYLRGQIAFYRKIADKLEGSLAQYDQA
ncbi:PREDICTED: sorting nexin lst-4-like [Priapulus caudatus]|uniref:Sorting nexin n=1 Tax=Priapulus caudatus TaxID=37621 RepID=A0ABM1EHI8_PRICU|nr:PREDICTED: sorting nexin lst-4-like [Priapulus caudatus]